jgi:hypothetical protein
MSRGRKNIQDPPRRLPTNIKRKKISNRGIKERRDLLFFGALTGT